MPHVTRASFFVGAFSALTACGGAGSNPFDDAAPAPFGPISSDEAALIDTQFDEFSDRVLGLAVSPDGVVPTSGTATFTGMAQIVVTPESAGSSMTLTGDAVVNADFSGPLLSAQMDSFTGADMSGENVRLDGELRVDGARIGGSLGGAGDVAGTFQGKLLGNDLEIDASGVFEGVLRGNPTAAISFSGIDSTALYNGEDASISLTGIAQE